MYKIIRRFNNIGLNNKSKLKMLNKRRKNSKVEESFFIKSNLKQKHKENFKKKSQISYNLIFKYCRKKKRKIKNIIQKR